ncbi:MAG: nucleotide exchange factor GrpE [Saprospiraceae bacterium]|nr:nucleotide exchange factor GrpE [Lewinella sp.]
MNEPKDTRQEEDEKKSITPQSEQHFTDEADVIASNETEALTSAKEVPFEIVNDTFAAAGVSNTHLEELREQLELLENKMDLIKEEFQSKLKYDKHKEKIIDNLHSELQTYKNDLIGKLLRPVFMDVIEVVDDIRRLAKDMKLKGEEDNTEKLWKFFTAIPDDLEDLLYKHGVEVVHNQEDSFDPTSQKAVKILPTDDDTLNKKVSERLKNGYRWEGKLLRHEIVNVWQYKELPHS